MAGKARAFVAAAVLVFAAAPAAAQRTLSWDELAVEARLDADGRLHVTETQVMVLDGDWNGGERRFDLRRDQELELHRLTRQDAATGATVVVVPGDLGTVDRYDWIDRNTLRWRSRLPSDPPFRGTKLVYVLTYTYANILRPSGGRTYVLDHDFAFGDRPGAIRRFSLDLALDPIWSARGPVPTGVVEENLSPGSSVVWKLALVYGGSGRPAGVEVWGRRVATASWAALLGLPPLVLAALWRREKRLGRLDPVTREMASRQWFEQNVLPHPPEVIGAAWDESVGAPEVGAVIARLQAEGTLESEVDDADAGSAGMTLRLKAPRRDLAGYAGRLVDGLFFGGRETTSTRAIRDHYKSTGFNPAALIRDEVRAEAEQLIGKDVAGAPSWIPGFLLFIGGVALVACGGLPLRQGAEVWFFGLFGAVACWAGGAALAGQWRTRVDRGLLALLPSVVLAAAVLGIAVAFLRSPETAGWRSLTHAGAAALALAVFVSVTNAARSRRGPVSIRLRKRLCAVRRFFLDELKKPAPALADAWFPYVVAFGLEDQVESWFGRFGPPASSSGHASSPSSSSGGSTGGSPPASWTGGGGSFGGAGATSSWAAAVSGLASGVAAPSSSGSGGSSGGGGGGGGGGSSGGGGGGGW
jgi:uncharacterized membrane protein YgcG